MWWCLISFISVTHFISLDSGFCSTRWPAVETNFIHSLLQLSAETLIDYLNFALITWCSSILIKFSLLRSNVLQRYYCVRWVNHRTDQKVIMLLPILEFSGILQCFLHLYTCEWVCLFAVSILAVFSILVDNLVKRICFDRFCYTWRWHLMHEELDKM